MERVVEDERTSKEIIAEAEGQKSGPKGKDVGSKIQRE